MTRFSSLLILFLLSPVQSFAGPVDFDFPKQIESFETSLAGPEKLEDRLDLLKKFISNCEDLQARLNKDISSSVEQRLMVLRVKSYLQIFTEEPFQIEKCDYYRSAIFLGFNGDPDFPSDIPFGASVALKVLEILCPAL